MYAVDEINLITQIHVKYITQHTPYILNHINVKEKIFFLENYNVTDCEITMQGSLNSEDSKL